MDSVSPQIPPPGRRLVLCLDGTWNREDSSTNVLHHFTLAINAQFASDDKTSVPQLRHYLKGVGTGPLDNITGGGFGFGLEANVREAYNWLVANYHGGAEDDESEYLPLSTKGGGLAERVRAKEPKSADEIYIFGFSRGAYTARSLVGFIASCGLLRRGAPVSVEELWQNYCILGRQREQRHSFWDSIFGDSPTKIRRITELIKDPWTIREETIQWERTRGAGRLMPNDAPGRLRGQVAEILTEAEALLIRCSRRVRITYLGVYDTVGALGLDALAIPGIKSHLAMHHNLRATTIIQHCRHALAVDEHRSSFNHTPFQEFIGHGEPSTTDDREDPAPDEAVLRADGAAAPVERVASSWQRRAEMWRRRITQRWFVGAHSNVGGGYPDDQLAQVSLRWLLEGAVLNGLRTEDFQRPDAISFRDPDVPLMPNDSYVDFAWPFWTQIIRGKRFYRVIDPTPEVRAALAHTKSAVQEGRKFYLFGFLTKKVSNPGTGFTLRNIDEQVDDSVFDAVGVPSGMGRQHEKPYQPPNVIEYARRRINDSSRPEPENKAKLIAIAAINPAHVWISNFPAALIVVLWATLASYGLDAASRFFCGGVGWTIPVSNRLPVLCFAALLFALIDWKESKVNFALALNPLDAPKRALCDTLYWLRTFGFILLVFGFVEASLTLWLKGWRAHDIAGTFQEILVAIKYWWTVPVSALIGAVLANIFDGFGRPKRARFWYWPVWVGNAAGVLTVPLLVLIAMYLGRTAGLLSAPFIHHEIHPPTLHTLDGLVLAPFTGEKPSPFGRMVEPAHLAGLLLLLEAAAVCFFNSFSWIAEPMSKANLGTIVTLQLCGTRKKVIAQFDTWRNWLSSQWRKEDLEGRRGPAGIALGRVIRESLYRDMYGYIPLYTLFFLYGMWFAKERFDFSRLGFGGDVFQSWFWVPPLVAATADYIEDSFQLSFLGHYEAGTEEQIPAWAPAASMLMSLLKIGVVICSLLLTLAAMGYGSWQVAENIAHTGWRGTVSILVVAVAVLAIVGLMIAAPLYRFFAKRK